MAAQRPVDVRLDRLQLVAVVLPLAYIVALVTVVAAFGLPIWAAAAITMGISLPVVAFFAFRVFRVINDMRDTLVRREARFRGLLESAPDAVVIVDGSGDIVVVNAQTEKLFGYAAEELIGLPHEKLIPERLRERHVEHRMRYQAHPATRPMGVGLALIARHKDGHEFPVEISLSPIQTEDGQLIISTVRDISERKRLEEERERLLAEAETERERQRIGMDLHDGVIQSIYAVGLNLENAATDVREQPGDVEGRIDRAIEQLNDVIRDIRSYILALRPTRFTGDLAESIAVLADDFHANSLIETSVSIDPALPPLDGDQSMALFHITQEALNNVRKHARATSVAISLRAAGGAVRLQVRDNGEGFDAGAAVADDHHGLRNMASRAHAAGGTLSVDSSQGAGTAVTIEIPALTPAGEKR